MLGDNGLITVAENSPQTDRSELLLYTELKTTGRCLGLVQLFNLGIINGKEDRAAFLVRVYVGDTLVMENRHINRASWKPQRWRAGVRLGESDSYVAPTGTFTIVTSGTTASTFESFFAVGVEPAPEPTRLYTAQQMPLWFVADVPPNTQVRVTVKAMVEEPTIAGGSTGGLSDDLPPVVPEDPDPEVDYDLEPDEVATTFAGAIRCFLWRIG